ncbi:MAG: hypothetical protein ACT4OF_10405, partial [Caulobacteraceae bacterium]
MRTFLFAVLALAACAQPGGGAGGPAPQPQSELARQIHADNERLDRELRAPGTVAAGIGETADLAAGLTVRPLEVIEDSRCAANVQCVWAGRLRLRANVSGAERELTLGEALATPNGAVLLAVAKPGAWADWPEAEVARPPYRF